MKHIFIINPAAGKYDRTEEFSGKIAAACAEPFGTGIVGAWVSALVVAPMMGKSLGFAFFSTSFLMSSVPGALIGAGVLYCLRKRILSGQTVKTNAQ